MTQPQPSLAEATSGNTSFSRILPGLQLAVDSTSLGDAKTCWRRYYYTIVQGHQPKSLSVHLTFGLLVHGAREQYEHARVRAELSHDESLLVALEWVLVESLDKVTGRPWDSGDQVKHRMSLIRTVVWYLDNWGENDPIKTIRLANGKPTSEFSFSFHSGYQTSAGEDWILCGHLDRIGELNGQPYIIDVKTTSWGIDGSWFAKFSPFNQFSLYSFAGQVVWHQPIQGLIVEGCQVGRDFARFERGIVPRPQPVIDEWYAGLGVWLSQMEELAQEGSAREARGEDPSGAWPMNEMSCGNYSRADGSRGGCEFRGVCSRPPASRPQALALDFKRRVWDPLQRRGDI